MKKAVMIFLTGLLAIAGACTATVSDSENTKSASPAPAGSPIDHGYTPKEGVRVIYLAGGCFWGTEHLMQSIPGVINVTSGYANGESDGAPSYQAVVTGATGYRETVRVEYDPEQISLDAILFTYFASIDPTAENQQGNDIGTQYQTGVYYADDASRETVLRIAEIGRARNKVFKVEIAPLTVFYDAEEYHQNYLENNPLGYCHIPAEEMQRAAEMIVDPGDYPRPDDETIKEILTVEQYDITQQAATEAPFACEYWDNKERGLYVDIVTGEPLFSSSDKFESGTGWPSFWRPIDPNVVVLIKDNSHGMQRVEVRSRAGNSHLGHVFYGESNSPNGVRYCINSASLRFIPYDSMEAEGFGYLQEYVKADYK